MQMRPCENKFSEIVVICEIKRNLQLGYTVTIITADEATDNTFQMNSTWYKDKSFY